MSPRRAPDLMVATHDTIFPCSSRFGRLAHLCSTMLWRPLVTSIKPAGEIGKSGRSFLVVTLSPENAFKVPGGPILHPDAVLKIDQPFVTRSRQTDIAHHTCDVARSLHPAAAARPQAKFRLLYPTGGEEMMILTEACPRKPRARLAPER